MINLTLTVTPETHAWLKREAGNRGVSASRLVGELLESERLRSTGYEDAMRRFFSVPAQRLSADDEPLPRRETLYD
jgi:hypothetical protein